MTKRWEALSAKEVNGKTYWTKLGVMFENRSGNGFTLSLDAIPVPVDGAYKIALFEPKENNDRGSNSGSGNSGSGNSGSGNSGSGNSGSGNSGSYSSGRPGANRGQSAPDHGQDDDSIPF